MNRILSACLVLLSGVASAQLCTDKLAVNTQPPFSVTNMPDRTAIDITAGNKLKLNTALVVFDPEKIILPVDQRLTISYVYESAGATHTIGYLYYEDLVFAGYINDNGTPADSSDDTLKDVNANGVADFHEDMFNLAPSAGPKSRPYVGDTRRCTTTFNSGGETFTVPELASPNNCDGAFMANRPLKDASNPAAWGGGDINVDTIGPVSPGNESNTDFSDRGLFRSVPNILEPAAPENGNRGLGRIIFVHAEDDGDTNIWNNFSEISDFTTSSDGVPDYDVSRYDATGRLRATNPDPGISVADRTVDLGLVPGNKELVFFMVSGYSPGHGGDRTYGCLRYAGAKCALHLISPINVFFSKARLNLDQNPSSASPAATRNIGCGYPASGTVTGPPGSPLIGSTQGCWLDGATLGRLNTPAYNNLALPTEGSQVPRPVSGLMPHVLVGAPTNDPYRWIFGFEDLTGGGDRDFNDVVVMVNKENGGGARAATVSTDIPIADANDMTITKVRFKRVDDVSRGAWTESVAGACAGPPSPSIRYFMALDCRICTGGACVRNISPTWSEAVFPPGVNEITVDTLALGLVGSQLCWRVDMTSPRDTCTPVVDSVDVGYQAVRAGDYSRSVVIPIANATMFGVYETPGQQWNSVDPLSADPRPSWRTYDNKLDYSLRGHTYFRRLFDPDSATPNATSPALIWDSAQRLTTTISGLSNYLDRRLYSLKPQGSMATSVQGDRVEVKDGWTMDQVLPGAWFGTQALGKYPYDLNRSDRGLQPATGQDRNFIRDWLYGWEDRQGAASPMCTASGECKVQGGSNPVMRAWPVGGVQLGSPAIITPPATPSWFNFVTPAEQLAYTSKFVEPLKNRETVSYIGTLGGFLHAFKTGQYVRGDDPCTAPSPRGYFQRTPCSGTRNYGDGTELFAYLPNGLLGNFVRNYIGELPGGGSPVPPAQVNAPPSFAEVDFGEPSGKMWEIDNKGRTDRGAKTVLVSSTGPLTDIVMALDVTDPSKKDENDSSKERWPIPLWEWRMGSVLLNWGSPALTPDTRGSRHSPPIIRADFGLGAKKERWITAIGTDFVPNAGTAGTVFLIDLITGAPVAFDSSGKACKRDRTKTDSVDNCFEAGVIPLQDGEGVGGEPSAVDANGDGSYDVLYVPMTSGRVYRINFADLDTSRPIDRRIKACIVADAAVTTAAAGATAAEAALQGIYSPLALNVVRDGSTKVEFYFGTADNPDDPTDASASRYYVLGYADSSPMTLATGTTCLATERWNRPLDPGQRVWGGVTLGATGVFAVTAVGTAADACNLSQTEGGRLYALNNASGASLAGSGAIIPPAVSGGQVYDEQFIFTTATGELKGSGSGVWNNTPQGGGQPRKRTLIWQPLPPGQMP